MGIRSVALFGEACYHYKLASLDLRVVVDQDYPFFATGG
jgi:hypothetical protein